MNAAHHRFDGLDLNLLRVFETVFRERHLTRAARVLALTPSAVSHALRRLREHLDDPLFVREGNAMVPTGTCQRMAPALVEQLAQLRGLLQQWGKFDPATSTQTFRIGIPEAVELMLLPPIHRAFARAAPRAALASVRFDRGELERALAARHLDLAVDVALPMREPVRHRPVIEDPFCLVVRKGHPFRRKPTLGQYATAAHVGVSTRATGPVLEDNALLKLGIERRIAVRCQSYATAFRLVAGSEAVLTVPRRLAHELGSARVAVRGLPFAIPPVQLQLYWHANAEADPANAWLRGLLLAVGRHSA
jgi:DNA-binding transcriptional LysR family regulator